MNENEVTLEEWLNTIEQYRKKFGNEPVFIGFIFPSGARIAHMKKAIKENKPLDELKNMSKEDQEAYKRGEIIG